MRSQRFQVLFIAVGMLIFWGYQLSHAASTQFKKNTHYTVCFSPGGNCERKLIHLIDNAHRSIYIQSYSFTSRRLAKALIQAKRRGVNVRMVVDRSLFDPKNTHSRIQQVLNAGIPVWVDRTVSIQHNKVMIIDQHTVETGSYNYSVSANRYNAENILIINSPELAGQYLKYWRQRQALSVPANHYHYRKRRHRR